MDNQNYSNHRRFDPFYHVVFSLIATAIFVATIVYLFLADHAGVNLLLSLILVAISVFLLYVFFTMRAYPLKAQDRAIRAEESLRHFVLTGKLLDSKLTISQIIALRFASDEEFPALCQKAAAENLKTDAIKKSIRQWRADHNRV